nr:helix-turn-helix domain-containing protein [Ectobacillus panaciterrae]
MGLQAQRLGETGSRKKSHSEKQIEGMLEMMKLGRSKKEVQEIFDVSRTILYRYIKESEKIQG